MSEHVFGILDLGGSEIALDASHLLEVTALPTTLTPRPLAPAWALGSFTLRGALIPTIDLGRLLGLDDSATARPAGDHVAVVGFRDGRFGLRIAHVRDVVTIAAHQLQTLGARRHSPDALIPGMFIHPDEQRPIHVLDLAALFELEGMLLSFDEAAVSHPSTDEVAALEMPPDRQRALIVAHGALRLAIDAAVVREVAECTTLAPPVTRAPGYLGNHCLRQETIPVFDPHALLGQRDPAPAPARLVVLEGPHGRIALGITHIERMIDYTLDMCRPLAADDTAVHAVRGLLSPRELTPALLFDHKVLLEQQALSGLADIHASLNRQARENRGERPWQRFAFLSYGAAGQYVTPLNQVDAVLPMPRRVTLLNGGGPFTGTFQHLERTVSLVDLRQLLGHGTEPSPRQVLVVSSGDSAVGFMIDEVRLIDYIDAPRDSLVIRWRGDARPGAPAIESSKRLVALGEGQRQRILAVLCLAHLASLLSHHEAPACDSRTLTEAAGS
ncbi:purine-binding chemotaxis protein CheW [Kushneria sinocarnis]|uniref:Purine-binding chemotaxis protein CheW n=1 Tax=Kushneria sinocarnis TaxID=595502 RepID=A0A420X000_9GAMM|nr:chemotaxis protein CheW [Kushneria sinocarnis]RKR06775.1 purine-binding chemotaxis protein CheW [Kushneria sinocarnis]